MTASARESWRRPVCEDEAAALRALGVVARVEADEASGASHVVVALGQDWWVCPFRPLGRGGLRWRVRDCDGLGPVARSVGGAIAAATKEDV